MSADSARRRNLKVAATRVLRSSRAPVRAREASGMTRDLKPLLALLALAAAPALEAGPAPRLLLNAEDFARIARLGRNRALGRFRATTRSSRRPATGPPRKSHASGSASGSCRPRAGSGPCGTSARPRRQLAYGGPGRNVCPIDAGTSPAGPTTRSSTRGAQRTTPTAAPATTASPIASPASSIRRTPRPASCTPTPPPTPAIRSRQGRQVNTKSGARVRAQTLDEAGLADPHRLGLRPDRR